MKTRGSWRSRHPMLANVLALAVAAWMVGFSAYGVLRDDLSIPIRYGDGRDYHFHGAAAWLLFAGFVCVGASILVAVLLRRKAATAGQSDRAALILALADAFIILAMMFLKLFGVL